MHKHIYKDDQCLCCGKERPIICACCNRRVWYHDGEYCFLHDPKAELPTHRATYWFKRAHEHQYLELKNMIESFNLDLSGDALEAAIVMFASFEVGQNDHQIYLYLGCNVFKYKIRKFARNLRSNGIWQNGITYCSWMEDDGGAIALVLDCLVATGEVERC